MRLDEQATQRSNRAGRTPLMRLVHQTARVARIGDATAASPPPHFPPPTGADASPDSSQTSSPRFQSTTSFGLPLPRQGPFPPITLLYLFVASLPPVHHGGV